MSAIVDIDALQIAAMRSIKKEGGFDWYKKEAFGLASPICTEEDVDFFVKASPAVILGLITRLDDAERQVDEWFCHECNTVHAGLESLDLTCPSCRNGQLRPSSKQQRIVEDLLAKTEKQRDEIGEKLMAADYALKDAERQRNMLLAALKKFVDSHEECTDFEGFAAQIVSMDDYHEAQEAIAAAEGGV